MSGEVNKWGVKAELDWEALLSVQSSSALDSYGFCLSQACSVSQNDWGRRVTQQQPGDSEAFLRVQKVVLVVRVAFLLGLNRKGQSYR